MLKELQDTIVAIATPTGKGAISIVRTSGIKAIEIVSSCFYGSQKLQNAKSHTAHFGKIIDKKHSIVDEVVCTVFRAPRSYTGEDMIEINCHGGMLVTRRVLECMIDAGARPAEPGEFTKRSFLNGKIDLIQAEAVADLIKAQSDRAKKSSLSQLEGRLSKKIHAIRSKLINLVGIIELDLDFSEEEIQLANIQEISIQLKDISYEIDILTSTYKYGKIIQEGISVGLVGIANVGKSSMLNALLNENRAIVTDIPGTTRDFIEGKLNIEGIIFQIVDTAGLRKTKNPVEIEGVRRTWKIIDNSDIIFFLHDTTQQYTKEEKGYLKKILTNTTRKVIIIVENKIDLLGDELRNQSSKYKNQSIPIVWTSTITHTRN